MAIRQKIALLPLRNMAPRGVHPGWIRGAPGCTPCISTRCPLYSPSISPLSPLYGGDRWGMVGIGGEAPPEAPRLAAGHPVQCYGGGKSARLFAMCHILDSDLVSVFLMILTTVSGKWTKRTLQKWSTEPSQPSQPPPLYIIIYNANGTIRLRRLRRGLYLRIPTQKPVAAGLHPAATGCDGCDGCDARFCTF